MHRILLLLGLALTGFAQAAPSADIKALQYPAWIEQGGSKMPLAPGMKLRTEQVIATGEGARVLMGLPDGSEMKLGQNTRFRIQHLETRGTAGNLDLEANLALLVGRFRYAASALSRLTGQRKIDLKLSTATIGVRGTDYWAMTDAEHDAVCLFEGRVEVANPEQGILPLDKPTAFWTRYFNKPAQAPGTATAEELARFLSGVEMTPGSGVAVEKGRWRLLAAAEKSQLDAQVISQALRAQGYPTSIAKSHGLHEVRIDHFATRADAEAVLKRLSAQTGLTGSEAKVLATR